jgi:hypothetical protein
MYFYKILIILSFVFISCKFHNKEVDFQKILGQYQTVNLKKERSKIRRYIESKLSYAYSGFTLNLKEDSTFSMITCSDSTHGRWLIEDNRVQFSRLDSTSKGPIEYVPFMSCKIVGNRLKYTFTGRTREGKKMRILNILEKVGEPE